MKKTTFLITAILAALSFYSFTAGEKPDKDTDHSLYEIETETKRLTSYIMKTKTTIDNGGLKFTMTTTAWHDVAEEKLAVEAETLVTGPTGSTLTKNLDIIDGEWRYSINLQESTGRKNPKRNAYKEIFENVKYPDEDTFIQLIQGRGGRFTGNESILGRNCIVVETGSGKEEKKTWYYKGIPLKVVTNNMVSEVTLLEENVSIPVERFKVPAGITIK